MIRLIGQTYSRCIMAYDLHIMTYYKNIQQTRLIAIVFRVRFSLFKQYRNTLKVLLVRVDLPYFKFV